jgi:hypothetical protein
MEQRFASVHEAEEFAKRPDVDFKGFVFGTDSVAVEYTTSSAMSANGSMRFGGKARSDARKASETRRFPTSKG